ncbi:MAG: hypothetical protein FJZ58_00200 [Chlamydiae bacterium]|nr:hypothetical protein [Chlamydiota bacterium]
MKKIATILLSLFLCSCQRYFLSVVQDRVEACSLASSALQTPDPRAQHPPKGEQLIVEWYLPREAMSQEPMLYLYVVGKDYTEQIWTHPIAHRMDYTVYRLTGDSYEQRKGILTYRAEVRAKNGELLLDWKHQLWVHPICIKEES